MVGACLILAYAVGTAAMLMILPQDQVSRLGGLPEALQVLLQKLALAGLAPVVLLGLSVVMLGGLSSWFGAAARLPFAAGLSHSLPPAFAKLSPKTGAPVNAIWTQVALVILLLILSQAGSSVAAAYDFMIAMGALSTALPYLFMFIAWWKISQGQASKLGAVVGFVVTASAVLGSLVPSPDAGDPTAAVVKLLFATLIMTLTGVGLYYVGTQRAKAAT